MFTETIGIVALRKRLESLNGEENKLTVKQIDTILNLVNLTKSGMLTFNTCTFSWTNVNNHTNVEFINK